ncbi:hypothetical protein ABK040_000905 [Willaertia magna]
MKLLITILLLITFTFTTIHCHSSTWLVNNSSNYHYLEKDCKCICYNVKKRTTALNQLQPLLNTAKHFITKAAATAISGAATVSSAIPFVNYLGFTASGITSKSIAASLMSKYVLVKGSGVASGSIVAVLQSIGATATLGPLGMAGFFVIGGGAGYSVYEGINNYFMN